MHFFQREIPQNYRAGTFAACLIPPNGPMDNLIIAAANTPFLKNDGMSQEFSGFAIIP